MAKIPLEIVLAGINISRESEVPIHKQLYEQIQRMILSKRLLPGDRLPPSRDLAKDLGVSRTTVIQSFDHLIIEGYLIGKPGAGTYVSQTLPDNLINASSIQEQSIGIQIRQKDWDDFEKFPQKERIIPFQTGTPAFDHFPYKIWQQVGNKVLQDLKSFNLGYSSTLGYWQLRKEIANYLRLSRAVNCDVRQVIIVNGALQGIHLLSHFLLEKGDTVWMEDPGYDLVKKTLTNRGVNIIPIPVGQDGIDIHFAINNYNSAKLLYVTPSHQYPLGSTLPISKRELLLDVAAKRNIWIVEDDYDSEFRYDGTPLPSLQGLDKNSNVIYTGTFSKVLFPALRLAYIVLPTLEMVDEFKTLKETITGQPPLTDQIILSQFIEQGHFLRHIRKMRILYAERRSMLLDLIKQHLSDYLTVESENAGMSVLAWLSNKVDPEKLRTVVNNKHIHISFLSDYTISHITRPAIILGYTAFSRYKLKVGIEKLLECFKESLKRV